MLERGIEDDFAGFGGEAVIAGLESDAERHVVISHVRERGDFNANRTMQ